MTLIEKHKRALDAARHIPTWTAQDELAWLAEQASTRCDILEIGTHRGHSAVVLAESTQGHVTCFDRCPDPGVEADALRNLNKYIESEDPEITLYHNDAGVTAVRCAVLRANETEFTFDMIWIDDGHTYADVVRDCLIALLLGAPNAFICGHDYETPANDVARAVNDCFGLANVKRGPGTIWYL